MRFESQLQVNNDGGTRTDNGDGTVTVAGANSVTLLLAAGTDYSTAYPTYRGTDPHAAVTRRVDAAAGKPYRALRSAHAADYKKLFNRVALDVGQQMPNIPTDDLLRAYRDAATPPATRKALEVLYFQYGRYLLIASSRDGSLPANLQGVWNNSTSAPWSADYHVNINLQMNYWPAETTNLTETTAPLFDYVDSLVPPGEQTAQEMFGNRGWVMHNETTPFGFTGVHDWPTAFWFPEAGAWMAQHYYEHYLFTRDADFLRQRAYPMLKVAVPVLVRRARGRPPRRQARRQPELLAGAGAVLGGRVDVAADRLGPVHQRRRGGHHVGGQRFRDRGARLPRPARPGSAGRAAGASCRSGRPTGTTRTTSTGTSRTCSRCTPAGRSPRGRTRHSSTRQRCRSPHAATAAPAGARPGRSTSGRGSSTATTRT